MTNKKTKARQPRKPGYAHRRFIQVDPGTLMALRPMNMVGDGLKKKPKTTPIWST
jgi:hypothetical protein